MVVSSLKQLYGLRYIYCWHGLSAYWSGVSPDPKERGVAKYNAALHYSQVCPSLQTVLLPPFSRCVAAIACLLCACPAGSYHLMTQKDSAVQRHCICS